MKSHAFSRYEYITELRETTPDNTHLQGGEIMKNKGGSRRIVDKPSKMSIKETP